MGIIGPPIRENKSHSHSLLATITSFRRDRGNTDDGLAPRIDETRQPWQLLPPGKAATLQKEPVGWEPKSAER